MMPGAAAESPDHAAASRLAALEAELRHARGQLLEFVERDALKTQFLLNISHDLRTPLTAIITHAEILREGILGEITTRQHESVSVIIAGGRQLLDMIAEILLHARESTGPLPLDRTTFSIAELIGEVAALNESLAERKGLHLNLDLGTELPMVHADRKKVVHVVTNLLGNAFEFTPTGGHVWINGTRQDDGESVLIEVGDTGLGIAADHHDLIFREFAQVDFSASRAHHGTGLGLTIAKRYVEQHGGRMWVESALTAGSRFFFTLPTTCGDE